MSKWTVTVEPRSDKISMHPHGLSYNTYWLTQEEAQDLADDLQEALWTLEGFYQNTEQGLADAAAGRWVEDADLDAFVQKE